MSLERLRVAICQLTCHPCLVVADRDALAEPILVAPKQPCLADLSRNAIDVTGVQEVCRRKYLAWHEVRIRAVLSALRTLNPPPDVVAFPECSIPISSLHELLSYADESKACVFAGTHSVLAGPNAIAQYESLRIAKANMKEIKAGRHAGAAVLPIITSDQTFLHFKALSSPSEHTDITTSSVDFSIVDPVIVEIRGEKVRFRVGICSEAARMQSASADYDVLMICAFNDGIEPFLPAIMLNVQNRRPALFVNDGHSGASSVHVPIDRRMTGIWWWEEPLRGRLPHGDAILVVDVNLNRVAPEVGVANPAKSAELVRLMAIVPMSGLGPQNNVTKELERIASISDPATQADLLQQLKATPGLHPVHDVKIGFLERMARTHAITPDWWARLLPDCVVDDARDLTMLERELAQDCLPVLESVIRNIDDEAVLGKTAKLVKTLRQRVASGGGSSVTSDERPTISASIVDRKDECRDVQGFLDSPTYSLLLVTGLDEVGKMTVIEAAHAQSGRSDTLIIRLTPESSLEFLLNSVARSLGLPADVLVTDLAFAKDQTFVDRIRSGMSVIIDNGQFLTDHGAWRDNRAGDFIRDLAEAVSSRNGKLILVSNRRLDVDGFSQTRIRRLPIGGLHADDARIVLDQHLRRVGLRPEHFPQAERQSLAAGLGGHPGAIALAASYVEESGFATVSDDVRQRRGVHEKIVARILRQSQFSDEESLILALLCLARVPVPINVFQNVVSFAAAPSVFSLIHQTIVDRGAYDRVSVNDLVRGYASLPEVDETTRILFHKAAASQFTNLAKGGEAAQHLRWAVEAEYHARLAGDSNLAPKVTQLIDGALGAIQVLIADHQYEKAKPLIDHLLASQRLPEVTELAALVHARLGLADDALTLAKETVALDSTRTWILSEVGRVALFVHRQDIAENAISLARKLGRDDSYLAVLEGQVHLRDHNSTAAAECFQRAVHLSESERFHNTWPYFYCGRTLLKLNRVPEALDILFNGEKIEAEKQRPNRKVLVALRTQLALANLLADNHENAARLMALVYEEDRGNPEVVWAMAFLRGAQQSTDVATTALRELDPNKARDRYQRCQIHLYRALIWLGLGEKDQASRELSFAHAADPRNVFVLLRWADTLLRMAGESQSEGEPEAAFYCAEQAKTLCNKVLEFNAGNAEALAMLERISDEFGLR